MASAANWRRFWSSGIVALVAFAVPAIVSLEMAGFALVALPAGLVVSKGRSDLDGWSIALLVATVVGPMVFALLRSSPPDWGYGLGFALVPALTLGICGGIAGALTGAGGWAFLFGVLGFVVVFLLGMAGASVSSLIGRLLGSRAAGRGPVGLRPWHVGVGVAAAEIIAVVAVAAAGRA